MTEIEFERKIEEHYMVLSQVIERYNNRLAMGEDYINELEEILTLIKHFLEDKKKWE